MAWFKLCDKSYRESVRLHQETAKCLNIDVAKIFVKVDLSKDLPKKMKFNIQGEEVMVE